MTTIKTKEIRNTSKQDRERKVKELKLELMKAQSGSAKTGNSKSKQIRKTIARILTIKN